jgi:hypothetical protein
MSPAWRNIVRTHRAKTIAIPKRSPDAAVTSTPSHSLNADVFAIARNLPALFQLQSSPPFSIERVSQ